MEGADGNPASVVGSAAEAGVPTPTAVLGIADVPPLGTVGLDNAEGLPSASAAGVPPDGENAYSGGSVGDRLASLVFRSDSTAATALADGAKITR